MWGGVGSHAPQRCPGPTQEAIRWEEIANSPSVSWITMSATSKVVFVLTVTLTCVLLLLTAKAPKHFLFKSRQRRHTPWPVSNSTAINDVEPLGVWRQLSPATVRPQCRPVGVPISVLGRRPERCVLTGEDDIYVSIKTTSINYETRLPIILLTWLQSVRPEQVLKISNDASVQ